MGSRLAGRFAALLFLALTIFLFPLHRVDALSPSAPAGFTAAPGEGRAVTLTWDSPNDPTITAYQLRRTAAGVTSEWLQFGTHATTHVSANIEYGVQYTFELRAIRGTSAGAIATVTIPPRPAPSPPGGSGGGPVGGGGSSAPRPSKADFEWTVTRDLEALAAGNERPTGAWSDGRTLWLANNADGPGDAVYAYDLASGERIEDREFALDERNRAPRGVWAGGGTAWVSDSGRDRLFAYDLASAERLPERDIQLVTRNAHARGLWGGGGRIWVLDGNRNSVFAYGEASGDLLGEYGLDAANGEPHGLWSSTLAAISAIRASSVGGIFGLLGGAPGRDSMIADSSPSRRRSGARTALTLVALVLPSVDHPQSRLASTGRRCGRVLDSTVCDAPIVAIGVRLASPSSNSWPLQRWPRTRATVRRGQQGLA